MAIVRVGSQEFDIPAPKGMRSFALQQRIGPVAGDLIGGVLSVVGGSVDANTLLETDVLVLLPKALPAIGQALSKMPPGELETLTRELLLEARIKQANVWMPLFGGPHAGADDLFDTVMAGKSLETWRLLYEAVRIWYPDFFAKFAAAQGLTAKAKSSTVSTT